MFAGESVANCTVSKSMDVNLNSRRKNGGMRIVLPLRGARGRSDILDGVEVIVDYRGLILPSRDGGVVNLVE